MELHSKKWQTILINGAHELGIDISLQQTQQFVIYAQELVKWNKKINLTTITDPFEIAVKHFIDSIAPATRITKGASLVDIGSGGGFPGIPLKLVIPSLSVILIDASRKKVSFLKQIIRILKLKDIDAIHIRAEDISNDPAFVERFDIAVSRAFSRLDHFFDLSFPLIKSSGIMIAMKGKRAEDEAMAVTGTTDPILINYNLPFLKADRSLVILEMKMK